MANAGGDLSGREAVEQAGKRLIPLFAQVDAHTQRWVARPGPANRVGALQRSTCRPTK